MDNFFAPHIEVTSWLYRNLPLYESWAEQDFDNVIARISSLPIPDTPEKYEQLASTRFGETIKRLTYEIGVSPFTDGDVNVSRAEVSAQRLMKLWDACERFAKSLEANVYAGFMLAALRNRVPSRFLVEVACSAKASGLHESSFYWAGHMTQRLLQRLTSEALDAIHNLNLDHLIKTFEAAGAVGIKFQKGNLAAFAATARDARNASALEFIWSASTSLRESFEFREWGLFANAAGNLGCGKLLGEIWEAWKSSGGSLNVEGFLAFARNALRTNRADLLGEVWRASEHVRQDFQASGWGLFAKCAGDREGGDLFEDIWRSSKAFRNEFNQATWGAFANGAGRVRRPDLVRETWHEAEIVRHTFDGNVISSFANAAGRVEDGDLLRDVWQSSSSIRPQFANSIWSSFVHATEMARLTDLFEEVWASCKSASYTFDHAEWGNFIHAAHSLQAWSVLLEMFRIVKEIFEPTRYIGYGTLYRPLLTAATACPDAEMRQKMFLILRLQGATIEGCLQVMCEFAPQPLAEKGLRFEGAGRTLMRYLNYSFYFKPEDEFIAEVDRVIDDLLSLPTERQLFAWVHLLGRGQESHRMLLRARYASALLRVAGISSTPWPHMSDSEKEGILSDLRNQTGKGLVGRIRSFILGLDPERLGLPDSPEEDAAYERIVAHIVANNEGYFEGGTNEESFFELVGRYLSEAGIADFTRDTWSRLVRTLIARLAASAAERMRVELQEAAHDLVKASGEDACNALNQPDLVAAAIESIGYGLVDTIQCFELMVIGMGQREREKIAVNIRPVLRMFLERGFLGRDFASVEIPQEVRVSAWHGAKRDLVMRIFGALRANVDRAFQMMPTEKLVYDCRVTMVDGWWRFVIENSFDPKRQHDAFSSGIGLKSVRRRLRLLGGRELPPPFTSSNTSLDPPMWRVNFELRAASEEAPVE